MIKEEIKMKIIGFYVEKNVVVSPTIFREIALNKVSKLKLGKVKQPTFRDRYDIIEFENQLPKLKVNKNLKNSLQTT